MLLRERIVGFGLLTILLYSIPLSASVQKGIRSIEIETDSGGMGVVVHAKLTILHQNDGFVRDGKPIDVAKINALMAALRARPIAKPGARNLGISRGSLVDHLPEVESSLPGRFPDALPSQRQLFETSFTAPAKMANFVPALFNYSAFDIYQHVKVEVVFNDGSKVSASSNSIYAFMLPWKLHRNPQSDSFNAAISRSVSALLPDKSPNKEQLAGVGFYPDLAEALMQQIKGRWNLLGAEGRAGSTFAALRRIYTVKRADINPYQDLYFGKRWSADGPHETNLHAVLRQASFPPNVQEHLVLRYEDGKVEGLEGFLRNGPRYESLALSVPWLNEYLRKHPNEMMTLMYVHHKSFGDHAMETFALDMKATGREDLIPPVRSQQSEIDLLKIDSVYWLLFPDHHMVLWRFEGPSGFLKWKQSDFPAGKCDLYYAVNNGGCPGSEITSDGTFVPGGESK